jgi:hypothetical protein
MSGGCSDSGGARDEPRPYTPDASDATRSVLDAQLRELQPFGAAELPWVIPIVSNDPDAGQRVAAAIRGRARGGGSHDPEIAVVQLAR